MITDAIIRFFSSILTNIVNLIPEAPLVAVGQGASTGSRCCAVFLIASFSTLVNTATSGAGILNKTPLAVLIDFYWLGFTVGCLMSIAFAFLIVRTLIIIWQQVKW